MQPFNVLRARAVPMAGRDINTDQIVPARFMHLPREDYGRYCFHDLRFDADGRQVPHFVLNRDVHRGASILLADRNFGCGSSREHAVYTLFDFGFRAILAPSFGDIFRINCHKNGLLAVEIPDDAARVWREAAERVPASLFTVDLPGQVVTGPDGTQVPFDIDPFSKNCLVQGIDEIDFTLGLAPHIDRFEDRRRKSSPTS
ncbi:3-isopropylmalate dehydratase [Bordetella sp. H567]|uniref:3-isopropylmalate dehydratase small subunit n=1 Tax=Bordetella sp. H567 TaxID=1697043 RepID=UPI00081C78F0|nr:3-isopropylmalate dehydratase small subunit [Bordetella sp. H567]AOB29724.1 3-isopropylmalate dehydratase [Bordetella sp. H567]